MSTLFSIKPKKQSLSKYSTFKIGGPALVVEVKTYDEMRQALEMSEGAYCMVGKGSNSVFPDEGLKELVIVNRIDFYELKGTKLHVGGGFPFTILGTRVSRQGLSGLEFASGIPGTVGGAVFMNAGAAGHDISEVVSQVEWMDNSGHIHLLDRASLNFSYRKSPFQEMKGAIVAVRLALKIDPDAKSRQREHVNYRMDTQPWKEASCGCVFKNPVGTSAGRLIEEAGLKGCRIGDAEVSHVHANFIVNKGNAKAEDVRRLRELIKMKVQEKAGIDIESEVRFVDELKK